MLLGVKWVLRYRPGAECKDPGCPAALLHQPTISQEQAALHENNYDLFKFEEFVVKEQRGMEVKMKNPEYKRRKFQVVTHVVTSTACYVWLIFSSNARYVQYVQCPMSNMSNVHACEAVQCIES